jgi:hypothetical protein
MLRIENASDRLRKTDLFDLCSNAFCKKDGVTPGLETSYVNCDLKEIL